MVEGGASSLIVSQCHFRCAAAAAFASAAWLRHKTIESLRFPSRVIDRLLKAEWRHLQGLYSGGEGGEAISASPGRHDTSICLCVWPLAHLLFGFVSLSLFFSTWKPKVFGVL